MMYKYFIGIDISKKTLDFAALEGKNATVEMRVENSKIGIKSFITHLKKMIGNEMDQVLFCMEHTGIYNENVLHYLFSNQWAISLQSSVHIKQSMGLQRGKNDRIDALRIAQFAYKNREELKLWQPPRQVIKQLKTLSSHRSRLIGMRKQLSVPLKETSGFDKEAAKQIMDLSKNTLRSLEKDLECTEKRIEGIIEKDQMLNRLFKIITSIDGVGPVTAVGMITTTNEFKDIQEPAKYACYAGVAPFEHSSGSSVRGKPRVSHKANKDMKTLLHMAALVAISCNAELKEYYERKVLEGKNKMLIINNVRNKLVWRIFSCVNNNRLYEKKYLPTLE
jgi:transposase